jgi:hypothetical protein
MSNSPSALYRASYDPSIHHAASHTESYAFTESDTRPQAMRSRELPLLDPLVDPSAPHEPACGLHDVRLGRHGIA